VASCSHCGGDLPAEALFCPSCGRRTDAPPYELKDLPVDIQHAQPRYFGLGQPIFVFSLLIGLLVLGIVLLVLGSFAFGVIAIIFAACLLPAFLAGARRWPDNTIARVGISTADRVRDEADVAVTSISTWSRAGRDIVRLRKETFQLRRERDAKIRELGLSVYEDDGRSDELKTAAKELDERIAADERELQRTVAGARRRVRKDRAAVVATEVIKPESDGVEIDAAEAAAGEGRSPDPADDVADAVDVEQRS
jgi:hypothetical protein